jgi:hypothetical protein
MFYVIFIEVDCFCKMGGKVKRPLCFRRFVPSPFCEGVRFPDRSKGLLRTYVFIIMNSSDHGVVRVRQNGTEPP